MIGNQDILIVFALCNWKPYCLVLINFPWEIHFLGEDKIGVFWLRGWWELVLFWIWLWMHNLFLCLSEAFSQLLEGTKYGWLFLLSFCAPGLMISLAKKWIGFLWLLSPIQIEWGSSRMRGDSPTMCFLTCTRRRSLKNICQESLTPSLVSFDGSNLTCISLCLCLVFPSW